MDTTASLQACATGAWWPAADLAWRLPVVAGLLLVAGWVAGHRFFPGQRAFWWLQVAMAAWLLASGAERASGEAGCKLALALASWPAIMAVPTLWTLFLYQYVNSQLPPTPWRWRALVLVPVGVMTLLAWSNPQHGLLYGAATGWAADGARLHFDYGPAFYVAAAFNYLCLLGALLLVARAARRAAPALRPHLLGFLLIACVPWAANIAYLGLGLTVDGADPTPLAFGAAAIGFGWLVARHRLFAVVPLARRLLWTELPDPLLIVDAQRHVVEANPAALALAGQAGGLRPGALADWPQIGAALAARLDDPAAGPLLRVPGAQRAYELRVRGIGPAAEPIGHLLQLRDVTEQQRAREQVMDALAQRNAQLQKVSSLQAELRDQALRDPLTGLLNRRALTARFHALAVDPTRPIALGLLDIDHFKRINDEHGHAAGDEVLRRLGATLAGALRDSDGLFRIGGEEFALLMPGASAALAAKRLDGLRHTLRIEPPTAGTTPLAVTFSAGVAGWPASGAGLDDLLRAADRALYRAKAGGRDRVELDPP